MRVFFKARVWASVMNKKVMLCCAVLSACVVSSSAFSLSLEQSLVDAYLYNPELKAERARVQSVGEGVSQAFAGWMPRISITGETGYRRFKSPSQTSDYQGSRPQRLGIELKQNIFAGFRTVNSTRASENRELAATARLLEVEQRIFLGVAQAYLDVVRDQALVGLNANNKQVLARQLEATEDRMRVGELTRTDVSQAKARLAGATADHIKALSQLQVSRANFERLVGQAPGEVRYPDAPTALPPSLEEAMDLARAQKPSVRFADFSARAAGYDVDAAGGGLLPTVELRADRTNSYNQSFSDGNDNRQYGIALLVEVPLYQGEVSGRNFMRRSILKIRRAFRSWMHKKRRMNRLSLLGKIWLPRVRKFNRCTVRSKRRKSPWRGFRRRLRLARARCWMCSTLSRSF